jgi:subtilase family serine protease
MAFGSETHRYSIDGEIHFANAVAASIPAALAEVVESVRGLDDFRPKAPRLVKSRPDYSSSTGAHYLAPDDLAAIYDIAPLYQAGFNGAGQKLVIPGQTDIKLSDIQTFRTQFGLPLSVPQVVLYGPDPGVISGDQMEASLDLEWSGAVARNATIIYVNSRNVFESLEYAIDQNLGTVMSMSYGACEKGNSASARAIAQQANAQGITWINASGDSGAAGCDPQGEGSATQGPSVSFPADIPEVTGVGGTEFAENGSMGWGGTNSATLGSATSYLPEKAWNDTALGQGIEGGGGGASTLFTKPWWQSGPGVSNDNARDVPDLSLAASGAHDGYLMYTQGGFYVVGGTSASSPSFAGIIALLNQYLVATCLYGCFSKPQ